MFRIYFFIIVLVLLVQFAFGQALVINEFCSMNTSFVDEDNDTPDWFELYNNGSETINLLDYAISDNSSQLTKWKFPAISLPAYNTIMVFASGKDRRDITYYHNFIKEGDVFSYALGNSDIPGNWKLMGFDDSGWNSGPSGFGYGDNDDATIVGEGTISVFVRKSIEISDINNLVEFFLHVAYDDGFVAYLNGVEVARANLGVPNTEVPYNQTAENFVEPLMVNGAAPQLFILNNFKDAVIEGENILAIQVHNNSAGSSDLTLIPFLSASYNIPVESNDMPEILGMQNKKLHTNFKLSADGERFYLSNNLGVLIDQTDSIPLPLGVSYGRKLNSIDKWAYYGEPTPGMLNTTQAYDSIGTGAITFSPTGGKFSASKQISLGAPEGSVIYYTTDGSFPDETSIKYTAPITIHKTTVIRATIINQAILSVTPAVQTYIIDNRAYTLPVVSLSTDPYNLFDWDYGIYELGPNAEEGNPNFGANFWMDWERPINMEYFDKDGTKLYTAPAGVKIFGAWSRANAQKSLSLFARSAYGVKSFKYPFFKERENDKYKSLVLRNSGNDWSSTAMRDATMTGLVADIDIDRQAYQPAIVFINGEYWGIQNLREKINEDFLADNHRGVDADKVDILQNNGEIVEGSNEHYRHMISYITSNSLAKTENYDSVCKMMDVVNFMEYEIAEIYFDNTDWPGNNIKYWREQSDLGKWRWILYDTDFGFGIYGSNNYKNNTLEFALDPQGPSWPNPAWSTFLLRNLLKNASFKHEFINRFADRLNYQFKSVRVNHLIDSLKNNIVDEMPYHIDRWNHIWGFDGNVSVMKSFASQRPNFIRDHINNHFSLDGIVNLKVDVSDAKEGYVQVNSLNIKEFPWSGKYFHNNPVSIVAIPKQGYEFAFWEGSETSSAELYLTIPNGGTTLKAIFKVSANKYNSIVVNEINYKANETNDADDWIELYNTTGAGIDISGWLLKDSDEKNEYKFASGVIVPKRSYLVVCKNLNKFHSVYPNVRNVVGGLEFGLSSEYDMVRLYDTEKMLVDSLLYFSERPWPEIDFGQTIALINPLTDNAVGMNWKSSVGVGTPGTHNDYFTDIPGAKAKLTLKATCFPNPAENQAYVRWNCNGIEYVQVNVYNIKGELINNIFAGNCPKGTFEEPVFKNNTQSAGVYFIKITYLSGQSQTLKLVKI